MEQRKRKLMMRHKTLHPIDDVDRKGGRGFASIEDSVDASIKRLKMVYAQPRIHPGEWNAQTPLGFWDPNRSSNLGQTIRPKCIPIKKKKAYEKNERNFGKIHSN